MVLSSESARDTAPLSSLPPLSGRAAAIQESQIREASRYCERFGALNLAQGLPDFPAPDLLKEAACAAIRADHNQYVDPWGLAALRLALAQKLQRDKGLSVDPQTQVTVCCGATEALNLALMALLDPGDQVLIFEPFYENYLPNLATVGAVPRFVALSPPDWTVTPELLERVFSDRLKVVILNTPANPTGKVWSRAELELLAQYCQQYNVYVVTDEIYEFVLYEGEHISLITLPGMAERTILVSGFSKTFCVTGWRLGYAVASPVLSAAMRRLHDFLTICAPAPLQHAAVAALALGHDYYQQLAADYRRKRDLLFPALQQIGLQPVLPQGAYYIWADGSALAPDANAAAYRLAAEAQVAVVPGHCFVRPQRSAISGLRFCFAKRDSTLVAAAEQMLAAFAEK